MPDGGCHGRMSRKALHASVSNSHIMHSLAGIYGEFQTQRQMQEHYAMDSRGQRIYTVWSHRLSENPHVLLAAV